MTTSQDVRRAFDEINKAIIELEKARSELVALHSSIEELDTSNEIFNRVCHMVEPSSDLHEELYSRVEKARGKLREFDKQHGREKIKHSLGVAHNATNEAYIKIS